MEPEACCAPYRAIDAKKREIGLRKSSENRQTEIKNAKKDLTGDSDRCPTQNWKYKERQRKTEKGTKIGKISEQR